MANYFDQFDAPSQTAPPGAQISGAPNFFDQFDKAPASASLLSRIGETLETGARKGLQSYTASAAALGLDPDQAAEVIAEQQRSILSKPQEPEVEALRVELDHWTLIVQYHAHH